MSEYDVPDDQGVVIAVDSGVGTIVLNRPERLNAIGLTNGPALVDGLRRLGDDDDVRAVILTATGRGFCVGADLTEVAAHHEHAAAVSRGEVPAPPRRASLAPLGTWNTIMRTMRDYQKPLIAAVNGLAVGGGLLLACAADVRIAADTAAFSAIFARRGLAFEAGTSWYLPRLVGLEQTYRMVYTGDMYPAAEALRIGLVSEVVAADELMPTTTALARRIAELPAVQLALARMEVRTSLATDDPETMMMVEMFGLGVAQRTRDYGEGHAAFLEKRSPNFKGY